ncbi:fasciclin-2 isoform X2 [Tribolium madens]|uniref:fasciclin-2 isoform X2 n=1 Tax=Tribolium madens TaxID=41895 RepID=UPI001CF76097|nr:fasciclin-2 isoform X2 [Tribolium madens]
MDFRNITAFFIHCSLIVSAVFADRQPKLTIQPNTAVISKETGSKLALTCAPDVEEPNLIAQLEWRDSKNRRIESTHIGKKIFAQSNGRDLILFFQDLQERDAGNYTCFANYGSETLKSTVVVNTYVDITFVDAPESQYPKVGEDYLVKCKVHGNPTPNVEWSKKDKKIESNEKYVIQSDGLLIKNPVEADDGSYTCRAYTVITGGLKERVIKLEVIIPPVIKDMAPVSVIEGEQAWTKCEATGKPPPIYSWIKQRNSEDLSKSDRFTVKQTTGNLLISKVEFNDDDFYKCTAENKAGRVEKTVKINVMVKPKIYELLNVTAPVKQETKIICKARGRPTPKVYFRKLSDKEHPFRVGQQRDSRIILEEQMIDKTGETYGTLIISNLNRTDDGLYECIAENSAGTSYKNGHIAVEFPPTFARTKVLEPIAWTWHNHPGNLTCIPEAIPNATVVWKHNGYIIDSGTPPFKLEAFGPAYHLIVDAFNNPRFYGQYECLATNKHGKASHWIQLKEAKIPEVVDQVRIQTLTATTIKFNIVPPQYFDTLPIRSFTVQYKPEGEIGWSYARNRTWSFGAPYILENLAPEVTYSLRFAAANDVGFGPWRNVPQVTMPRRSEPAEPKIYVPNHILDNSSNRQDVIAVSPYADHFELRWQVPNDNGDPIDVYLIRYCVITKINGEWRDSDCSEEIQQTFKSTTYDLNSLKPDTIYKIELRAHNSIGSSSPAQIKVKTARGIDPAVPYNEPSVTNFAIIGIVVGAVILVLILVDLICFFVNRAGILAFICDRNRSKHHEEDPKLGSYKAAPAHPNSLNLPLPVKLAPSPMEEEREPLKDTHMNGGEKAMSVEFDGKHVYSKSGEIIGKHSAV